MYKSEEIANAIVAQKKLNPAKVRPHPECPWLESATQYHVALEDTIENIKQKTHEQDINMAADVEGKSAHMIASQFASAMACLVPQGNGAGGGVVFPGMGIPGTGAGPQLGGVPAGGVGGQAPGAGAGTGGVGGQAPGAAAEEERARVKAQKEADKKVKIEKEKRERERVKAEFDASDQGKAKKHLNELQPLIDSAAVYQGSAKKVMCINSAMRHEWERTFDRQMAILKKNRRLVEMVFLEKSEDSSNIDKSKAAAEEFKRQRRSFDALQRAAQGKRASSR